MSSAPKNKSASWEDLRAVLRRRIEIIADSRWRDRNPAEHLNALREVSDQIDRCSENLDPPPPPELAHYLKGKSLSKALAWLDASLDGAVPASHRHHCGHAI